MKSRHDQLAETLADGDIKFTVEYTEEYDQPSSIVRLVYEEDDEELDINVEVIYLDNVILLQDNGEHSLGRATFLWHTLTWATEAKKKITNWLLPA